MSLQLWSDPAQILRLGDTPSPYPKPVCHACVWGWEMVPSPTWYLLSPSPQGHALVSSGRVPGLVLHACPALGSTVWERAGRKRSARCCGRSEAPVVVPTSWGVISIVYHRRLFLPVVNSLIPRLCDLWCNVCVGQWVGVRNPDLDLDSSARGSLVYKAFWCAFSNSWCWGEFY